MNKHIETTKMILDRQNVCYLLVTLVVLSMMLLIIKQTTTCRAVCSRARSQNCQNSLCQTFIQMKVNLELKATPQKCYQCSTNKHHMGFMHIHCSHCYTQKCVRCAIYCCTFT